MRDLKTLLMAKGVPFRDSAGSPWIGLCCPFCGDSKFKAGYHTGKRYYNCFKCGYHSVESVLKVYHITETLNRFDVADVEETGVEKVNYIQRPLRDQEKRYLDSRGFDPDYLVKKYSIGSGGIIGDFAFRIIIPIIENGVVTSLQGRDWTGKQEMRYHSLRLSSSVRSLKDSLYNIDDAGTDIMVVEGPTDVWRLGSNVVCPFGIGVSNRQVELLKHFERVFVCFDSELRAQAEAHKLASKLAGFVDVFIVDLESENDFGDMSDEAARSMKKEILG